MRMTKTRSSFGVTLSHQIRTLISLFIILAVFMSYHGSKSSNSYTTHLVNKVYLGPISVFYSIIGIWLNPVSVHLYCDI